MWNAYIDHIVNLQNDALWEGQGFKCCPFRMNLRPLSSQQCIILETSDMVYSVIFSKYFDTKLDPCFCVCLQRVT